MDLKELLGEELFNQVSEKIGEHKLAIVSDGSYIPKTKFDAKIEEVKELKEQLADRDAQLEDLKKVDVSELQNKITELQQSNEGIKIEYESKLQQREFDYSLENALREAKAKNPKAVKALLNNEAIKLVDGKFVGLDEQLTALKTSDSYLFGEDGLKGGTPPNPAGGGKPAVTKEQFAQMNYKERVDLYDKNPELYKQLSGGH